MNLRAAFDSLRSTPAVTWAKHQVSAAETRVAALRRTPLVADLTRYGSLGLFGAAGYEYLERALPHVDQIAGLPVHAQALTVAAVGAGWVGLAVRGKRLSAEDQRLNAVKDLGADGTLRTASFAANGLGRGTMGEIGKAFPNASPEELKEAVERYREDSPPVTKLDDAVRGALDNAVIVKRPGEVGAQEWRAALCDGALEGMQGARVAVSPDVAPPTLPGAAEPPGTGPPTSEPNAASQPDPRTRPTSSPTPTPTTSTQHPRTRPTSSPTPPADPTRRTPPTRPTRKAA